MNQRQLLVFLPILGLLTCALYFVGSVSSDNRRNYSCQSNLKQISLALKQYTRDYDEITMLASNWTTVLQPYIKNSQVFDCPSAYGYALNRHLAGVADARVEDPKATPIFFDSTSTQPIASDFGTSYPQDGAHSLWKRGRGTNVAFFDGHVEWRQTKPPFLALKPLPQPSKPIYLFPKPQKTPKKQVWGDKMILVPIR